MDTLLEKVIGLDYTIQGNSDRWKNTEEHSSLVLDVERQLWFWNSRGARGTPLDYLINVKGIPVDQARKMIDDMVYVREGHLSRPVRGDGTVPHPGLVDIFWRNGINDRGYWYRRCLTDDTIDRFKLGKYDGYWMLPVFIEGHFVNFQCRTDFPEKKIRPWYRGFGPLLYNSSILPFVKTIFVTEGPVDAILLNQEGFPAVSHTGGASGWVDKWFPLFRRQSKIIYVVDNDIAGYNSVRKLARSLGENRLYLLTFGGMPEGFDTVEFFKIGNTKEDFSKLVDKVRPVFEVKEIYGKIKRI